jgi:type I restriction enzyme S subunit
VSQSASTIIESSRASFDHETLPDGWHWVRVGDVGDVVNGYGFAEHLQGRTDLPFPFIKVSDMNAADAETVISRAANTVDEIILKQLRARTYPAGTVIFPKVGGALLTNKKRLLGVEATFDNNVMGIVPKEVDSQFLFYWMQSFDLRTLANVQALPSIRQSDVAALKMPLPSSSEQKRIAAILNEQMAAVERARAAAEAQLKAAKVLPAAYLREVFDSQEAQQWAKEKLGNVSLISGGIQKTPDRKPKNFHRPYLTVRNVQRGYLDLSALERFEITESELARLRLMQGDILIVEGNGSLDHIGRNALFRGEVPECIHQNHIIRVRLDEQRFVPEFVSRFLNSDAGKSQMIQKAMTTSGLYTLSAGKVAALEIPMPSMRRQQEIVGIFSEMIPTAENASGVIKSQLDSIHKLPAALLRQAFTGKP